MAVFKIITLIYNKIEANGRKGGEKRVCEEKVDCKVIAIYLCGVVGLV